jgi:hypothetical protein
MKFSIILTVLVAVNIYFLFAVENPDVTGCGSEIDCPQS